MRLKILTTLYILKYDPNPMNSIYKVGITGKTANERCDEIRRTLSNGRIKVVWEGKFLGAYFIEQFIHTMLSAINVRMPETVSGYTEFFDLNWLSVKVLIWLLEVYQFLFFMGMIVLGYSILTSLGVIKGN